MKTTLVFVLAAALCIVGSDSAPQKRDVSAVSSSNVTADFGSVVKNMISAFNHMSPCGDPAMDIPVLEPLRIPLVTLDINHELLVLNGSIENMVMTGISDFIVIELTVDPTTNRTTYDFIYRDVQVLGEYNLYVNADLAGYKLVLNLTGLMNQEVKDLRVNGAYTVGTNAVGGVQFSDVVTYVQLGNFISEVLDAQYSVALGDFFNKFVQEAAMVYVKTRREFLNEVLSAYITEQSNTMLYNVTLPEYIQQMQTVTEAWNAISC